ncbi:hypothetical protein COV15_01890 [Candidatus Woesearchaeota archaeon CG10_big_fil_rev_8_21_14_0_10_34_12]|nr:MAG: hypothetical protein COV15_01890 [Candidatus Woesearchaeota archaeon CG10_big_fil_rev_8_21_14_0_10_34_12]
MKEHSEISEKERTMKLSIKEGSVSSVMSGLGDSNLSLFALALNANNLQMGFLSSFPGLVTPIAQIFGSRLMEKYRRKKIVVAGVFLHALIWFPILALGLMYYKNIFASHLATVLLVFYSVYAVLGAVAGPAWFSLLGDIVPENMRGKYFSKRNRICGTIALITTLVGAFFLDFFETKGLLLIGFSIFFFIAGIFRLIAAFLFTKHYEPKFKLEKNYYFSIWQFIKKAPYNNFGRFVIFVSLMHFATAIAGPFFTVYMRRDLGFSVLTYTIIVVASSVSSLLFIPLWGKFSDKYGNRELLRIGSLIIPFLPALWLISKSPYYLIIVPQLLSGFSWAAFNLGVSNFIYDSVSPQRRGICVAYFNVIAGFGTFLGASIGGFLAYYLTISFMNILLFIFLASSILRLTVTLAFLPLVKEVRKVKKLRTIPMLHFKGIFPSRGIIYNLFHPIKNN